MNLTADMDPQEFYNRQQDTDACTSDYSSYVDKSVPYTWALLNKGNRGLQIRSDIPCFRMLGLFKTQTDAKRHCAKFDSGAMDIYMYKTHTFLPINLQRHTPPEVEQTIVEQVTKQYHERKKANTQAFKKNVEDKTMGKIPESINQLKTQPKIGIVEDGEDEGDAGEEVSRRLELDTTHEIRSQRFIVWSYMEDKEIGEEPEQPIICIYAALEDEATAIYQSKFLSQKITDVNLVVSPMYEWIHLNARMLNDKTIPSEYRNKKLDQIMKRKQASHQQVETYVNTCTERSIEPTFKNLFAHDIGNSVEDKSLST
jgi:hypothetical protein